VIILWHLGVNDMAGTLLEALNVKQEKPDIVMEASKQYSVPVKFLKSIYEIESTSGKDKKAGTNVMQLTPIALKELDNNYGSGHNVNTTDDAVLNSAKYLRWLADKKKLNFDTDSEKLAYHYNAGAYAKGDYNKSPYVKKYRNINPIVKQKANIWNMMISNQPIASPVSTYSLWGQITK